MGLVHARSCQSRLVNPILGWSFFAFHRDFAAARIPQSHVVLARRRAPCFSDTLVYTLRCCHSTTPHAVAVTCGAEAISPINEGDAESQRTTDSCSEAFLTLRLRAFACLWSGRGVEWVLRVKTIMMHTSTEEQRWKDFRGQISET